MKKTIKINKLNKKFRKLKVFEDFSIEINNGINLLLGENGSGKTTLLNLIGNLDKKYKGEILRTVEDEIIKEETFFHITGFLPQAFELPEHLVLIDFLRFLGEVGYIEDYDDKINDLIKSFDLEDKKNTRISELSGGMKQRVGLISVMLKEPKFILLDEPLKNVSEKEREHILKYLSDYNRKFEPLFIITTNIPQEYEQIDFNEIRIKRLGV